MLELLQFTDRASPAPIVPGVLQPRLDNLIFYKAQLQLLGFVLVWGVGLLDEQVIKLADLGVYKKIDEPPNFQELMNPDQAHNVKVFKLPNLVNP